MSADIAEQLFDAMRRADMLDESVGDQLLEICDIDPEKPETWPLGDIVFDDYDASFEFRGVTPGWRMTPERFKRTLVLGFRRCWVCYTDGTESYCGGEPQPARERCDTGRLRTVGRLRRRVQELGAALEALNRGSCWCEMAIGNPMVRTHSPECVQARAALAKARGEQP